MQVIIRQKSLFIGGKIFYNKLDQIRDSLNTFTITWKGNEAIISDIDSHNPNLVIRCYYRNPRKYGVCWEICIKDMRKTSKCDVIRLKQWFNNLYKKAQEQIIS